MQTQSKTDTRIRTILVAAAEDAAVKVTALEKNSTFSAGVRTAQLRLVMSTIKDILNDVFNEITPVISNGQKSEAVAAVDALTETDREYLKSAFPNTGDINSFIDSQKLQAKIQLIHAINSVTKQKHTLSQNVYRTKALSQQWVRRDVTSGIARGASAERNRSSCAKAYTSEHTRRRIVCRFATRTNRAQ